MQYVYISGGGEERDRIGHVCTIVQKWGLQVECEFQNERAGVSRLFHILNPSDVLNPSCMAPPVIIQPEKDLNRWFFSSESVETFQNCPLKTKSKQNTI